MEYFLGTLATLITVVVVNMLLRKSSTNTKNLQVRYSQSHIFEILKPFYPEGQKFLKPIKETQSLKFSKESFVKEMVVEGKAYWIKDQTLYVAEMESGSVVPDTTKQVDTMAMDKLDRKSVV
jgi:patatin-like phospholipase/acyl hydrolase